MLSIELEKKGYVRRVHDQVDRRVTNIELTEDGKEYFEGIFPQHTRQISEIFSVLKDEELEELMSLLKKLGYHSEELLKQEQMK